MLFRSFMKVVEGFKTIPDEKFPQERLEHVKKLEQSIMEFVKIPYDLKLNKVEAKEIMMIYDKEIAGQFQGRVAAILEDKFLKWSTSGEF